MSTSRGGELKNPSEWKIQKIMFAFENEFDKVISSKMKYYLYNRVQTCNCAYNKHIYNPEG